MLAFRVDGRPVPQGSKTRTPGGGFREAAKGHHSWRQALYAVALEARQQHEDRLDLFDAGVQGRYIPIVVWARFTFQHIQGSTEGDPKATKPDLDKLQRAVGDALESARVFTNDSRIVGWPCCPAKVYGERVGVEIRVYTLEEWEGRDGV